MILVKMYFMKNETKYIVCSAMELYKYVLKLHNKLKLGNFAFLLLL